METAARLSCLLGVVQAAALNAFDQTLVFHWMLSFAATQCFLHLEIIEALEAQVVVAMNFLALMLA